ncbi:MAG: ThuA domain-containing protein [Oscillospiraceae bacterium]|nr:ThuA domain-containing protein [Oscillospiraceae bacterium]
MKVLLLCGDYWHPPEVPVNGVKPLEGKGFTFDIITDAKDFDPVKLKDYPVVLLAKSGEISQTDRDSWKTEAVQQAFVDYVESGGGLLAVHNATVAGKNTQTLDALLGCRFAYHPADCPVTVQPVKPHPIAAGAGRFCETDEHYRLDIIADDADVFMASYSSAQGEESQYEENPYHNSPAWICAAGYTRTQGKGRVCVLTPGHLLPVWHNAEFQTVLENALRWCAG